MAQVLTAEAVQALAKHCLAGETPNPVIVAGVLNTFGFDREKLAAKREDVRRLLDELPDQFRETRGGGWSFLNLCLDKHGHQWGEHVHMEQLCALAIGASLGEWIMLEMRDILPGEVPYFVYRDKGESHATH